MCSKDIPNNQVGKDYEDSKEKGKHGFKAFFSSRANNSESRKESDKERAQKYLEERNSALRDIADLEDKITEMQTYIAQLEGDLQNKQQALESIDKSAHIMQVELENKELFLGYQATDDEVRDSFTSINEAIKTWSFSFTGGGAAYLDWFQAVEPVDLRSVTPSYAQPQCMVEMIANKKKRRLFVRGFTTYIMSKFIWMNPKPGIAGHEQQQQPRDLWLDIPVALDFSNLENTLSDPDNKSITTRELNDWRAFTVELLSRTESANFPASSNEHHSEDRLQSAAATALKLIGPWATTTTTDKTSLEPERKLLSIMAQAVRFSALLRRQRALWQVRWPVPVPVPASGGGGSNAGSNNTEEPLLPPLMFDPRSMHDEWSEDGDDDEDEMEDQDPQQPKMLHNKRKVEIVISPTLYKRGNSDGERFDVECAVAKAEVVLLSSSL